MWGNMHYGASPTKETIVNKARVVSSSQHDLGPERGKQVVGNSMRFSIECAIWEPDRGFC